MKKEDLPLKQAAQLEWLGEKFAIGGCCCACVAAISLAGWVIFSYDFLLPFAGRCLVTALVFFLGAKAMKELGVDNLLKAYDAAVEYEKTTEHYRGVLGDIQAELTSIETLMNESKEEE